MQSNAYLILIIASMLAGAFTTWVSFANRENAQRIEAKNKLLVLKVKEGEREIAQKRKELRMKRREHFDHYNTSKNNAIKLSVALDELMRLKLQESKYEKYNEVFVNKSEIWSNQISNIEDNLQEEIAAVERAMKEIEEFYDNSADHQKEKVGELKKRNQKGIKEHIFEKVKREKELKDMDIKLKRKQQLVYNRYSNDTLEPLGKILEVLPAARKVIINLGKSSGIKQNFKFKVFDRSSNGDFIDKGFIIVKNVEDLYSVASLVNQPSELSELILVGDKIGSPAFRSGGRYFYLAGKFESKYNQEALRHYLDYMGNEVSKDLDLKIDMMVQGKFAEADAVRAANLGIRIINEDQLVPYLGE